MSGTSQPYESAPNYQPPPAGPAAAGGGSGLAIAALILGILSIFGSITVFGGVILGLLAVILGIVAVRGANRGIRRGKGMAIGGIITGAIGVILVVVLIVVGVSILNSPAGKNLRHCLDQAKGNQQAVQQCNDQYRDNVSN